MDKQNKGKRKQSQSARSFKSELPQPISDSTEQLHVEFGKVYKPGKAMRAPQAWNWGRHTRPNGEIVAAVIPPFSSDTVTTVRYEESLFDPEFSLVKTVVRTNPDVSIRELRESFPALDKRLSDKHFRDLKDRAGRIRSDRKFKAKVLADGSGYLDEDTIYRYLKFPHSRQIKKSTPGRPEK